MLFPALVRALGLLGAAAGRDFVANSVRNVWAHAIIFCGHFPEGAETFPEEQLEGETRGRLVRAPDARLGEPRRAARCSTS